MLALGASFAQGDKVLGSNGFSFTITEEPEALPNGIFYIDFGTDADEFYLVQIILLCSRRN